MPIRSTTHSKKTLKTGAFAFIPGWTWSNKGDFVRVPVRIKVTGAPDALMMPVEISSPRRTYCGSTALDGGHYIFPGDLGVRGFRYDNRVQQCFTTRKACEDAIKLWGDRDPNFIHELTGR